MPFTIVVTKAGGAESRIVSTESFSQALHHNLEAYCAAAQKLNESTFVKNWDDTRISLHMANDGTISNAGSLPADEVIESFLHRLRPIYLNDSDLEYGRISNAISAHFKDPSVAECLRLWSKHYSGSESQKVFEINVKGYVLNSEAVFGHYVNAIEYHQTKSRAFHVNKILEAFPLEALKPIFVYMLMTKLNAINKLASFILTCFDREDGRPITLNME